MVRCVCEGGVPCVGVLRGGGVQVRVRGCVLRGEWSGLESEGCPEGEVSGLESEGVS